MILSVTKVRMTAMVPPPPTVAKLGAFSFNIFESPVLFERVVIMASAKVNRLSERIRFALVTTNRNIIKHF